MSLATYIIVYALAVGGILYLVCFATITAPIRVALASIPKVGGLLRSLIYCPMCSAMWVGLAWGALTDQSFGPWWHTALWHGWAAIGIAHLWTSYTGGPVGYDVERAWLKGEADDASQETEKKDG